MNLINWFVVHVMLMGNATKRWYTSLNGINSYFELVSPIANSIGHVNTLKFCNFVNDGQYARFMSTDDYSCGVDSGVLGTRFRLTGVSSAFLDGTQIISESTPIPTDGNEHTLTFTSEVSSGRWKGIGAHIDDAGGVSRYKEITIYDVDVNGRFWALDEPYSESLIYKSDVGDEIQGVNIQPADVTQG